MKTGMLPPVAPKLEFALVDPRRREYSLNGWRELDLFARRNVAAWKCATERAYALGMSESDRLRLLCAALLEQNSAMQADAIARAQNRSEPL